MSKLNQVQNKIEFMLVKGNTKQLHFEQIRVQSNLVTMSPRYYANLDTIPIWSSETISNNGKYIYYATHESTVTVLLKQKTLHIHVMYSLKLSNSAWNPEESSAGACSFGGSRLLVDRMLESHRASSFSVARKEKSVRLRCWVDIVG